jgi:hypothetical protein
MKSLFTAVAMTVCLAGQSASACFFFPFFPAPCAGNSPWGMGWGAGYRPVSYGYQNVGYGGSCCNTGCGVYSAGYQSYSAPVSYGNSGCGTCADTFGSSIGQTLNYGGGSDCVGTESRGTPQPDDKYNADQPIRNFPQEDGDDFGATGSADETSAERRRRLDREREDLLRRQQELDREERQKQPEDKKEPWSPTPRAGEPGGSFGEDALDPLGKLPRPNPVGGAAGSDPPPFGSEIFGGGRKVPMPEEPASDAPVDHTSQKPEMPEIDEAAEQPATEQPATEQPATEQPAADFLPSEKAPESAADTRTSHTDVLKMQRLAGRTLTHSSSTSKVSSSHTNNKPARWISLPLPAGRVRS